MLELDRLLFRLAKAERSVGCELFLQLQSDGSGTVLSFADVAVFRFDRLDELTAWLRKPRLVEYEGHAVETVARKAKS